MLLTASERDKFDYSIGSAGWCYPEDLAEVLRETGVGIAIPAGRCDAKVRGILGLSGDIHPTVADDLAGWARGFAIPDVVDVENWSDDAVKVGRKPVRVLALRGPREQVEDAARLIAYFLNKKLAEWHGAAVLPKIREYIPND